MSMAQCITLTGVEVNTCPGVVYCQRSSKTSTAAEQEEQDTPAMVMGEGE